MRSWSAEDPKDDLRVPFVGLYYRGQRREDLEQKYFEVYHPIDERVPRLRQLPDPWAPAARCPAPAKGRRHVPNNMGQCPISIQVFFPDAGACAVRCWCCDVNLNVTKTAAVVIDSGPQNTVRFGAGPLRFGSQVVARRIDVFGPFRAVMAGRIGTWVARDCHIRVKTLRCNRLRPEMAPATCSVA